MSKTLKYDFRIGSGLNVKEFEDYKYELSFEDFREYLVINFMRRYDLDSYEKAKEIMEDFDLYDCYEDRLDDMDYEDMREYFEGEAYQYLLDSINYHDELEKATRR